VLDELPQAAQLSIAVGVYSAGGFLNGRFCGLHDSIRRFGNRGFQPFQEGNRAVQHGEYPPNAITPLGPGNPAEKLSTFEATDEILAPFEPARQNYQEPQLSRK
jgi:hypothetical protein